VEGVDSGSGLTRPAADRGGPRYGLILGACILAVTAFRLAMLTVSTTDLYVDEAQYWSWAQSPAWGYYSKPPMIAWLIALAQQVCGAGEACVRSPSALSWAVTAAAVGGVGATLHGRAVGLWAGLAALLAPGAIYSARIISTDAPLLAFWAIALLAFVKLRAGGRPAWSLALAAALAGGLLSKYAMLYLYGGLALAAVADPASRRALARPSVWLALAAGLAALIPNLIWQAGHGMATVRHTVDNATGGGATPGLADGLAFLAAQAVLAGPAVFVAAVGAWLAARRPDRPEDRLLTMLSLPIMVGVAGVAFVTRAHANWAATALVAIFVLGAAALSRGGRRGWMVGGLMFGLALQLALPIADLFADRLGWRGRAPFERTLGWADFADAVVERARRAGARTVVVESRRDAAALLYYGRGASIDVAVWPAEGRPEDHFQMDRPLTTAQASRGPVLAAAVCEGPGRFAGWASIADLGALEVSPGPGARRRWRLYRLERPTAAIRRPPPCERP
jgi:4-amino-4-deoxy-L-arabinose transferase-like glycosyltransferase